MESLEITVKKRAELSNAIVILKAEIKERKRMEQIIRDNILRMNIALESANLGAWDLDLVNDTSIRTLDHDIILFTFTRIGCKNHMKLTNYISNAESSGQIKRYDGLNHMETFIMMIKMWPSECYFHFFHPITKGHFTTFIYTKKRNIIIFKSDIKLTLVF